MTRPAALLLAGLTLASTLATGVVAAPSASADAIRDAQWYLGPLGVTQAWQTTKGAGVTVCVVDSGVDAQVPDLQGAVAGAKTFARYTNADGLVSEHGTAVAAFLAGRGHDGSSGVIGVAPEARLLSAVVDEYDLPDIGRQASAAIRWCTDQGAKVINLSIAEKADGGMSAAVAYAQSKDVVVVAASGNTFEKITTDVLPYPAVIPGVVAVTGIDEDLSHDGGAMSSTRGKPVSLSAPFSTTNATNGYPDVGLPAARDRHAAADARYDLHGCGTSFSSPIVAGVAALVRAAHPTFTADEVINTLLATATPAGTGGTNRTYGHGIVNAAKAVAADLPAVSANPLEQATPSGTAAPAASANAGSPTGATPSAGATRRDASSSNNSSDGLAIGLVAAAVVLMAVAAAVAIRRRGAPR